MNTTLYKIHVQAEKCLRFRGVSCNRCIDKCPTQALGFKGSIILSHDQCRNCGLCLHLCPTQVFSGKDEWNALVKTIVGFSSKQPLELICPFHPAPNQGLPECADSFQTATCIAALGPSFFLTLQARGFEKIILRLDACRQCPAGLQKAKSQIISNSMSSPIIQIIEDSPADSRERTVQTSRESSLTRRNLFRSLLGKANERTSDEFLYAPERTRLLHSLELLMRGGRHDVGSILPVPFFRVAIQDTCTACMACARSCPSGALRASIENRKHFTLEFAPGLCFDCKLCVAACRQDAILRTPLTSLSNFEELNFSTLIQDEVQACARCKMPFRSGETDSDLCPACAFRRQNPFGAIGLLKKRT